MRKINSQGPRLTPAPGTGQACTLGLELFTRPRRQSVFCNEVLIQSRYTARAAARRAAAPRVARQPTGAVPCPAATRDEGPIMSGPELDPLTPKPPKARQPHWLAVVAVLLTGLAVAGLLSYFGSTTLGG